MLGRRYSGVTAFSGMPGGGKTYGLAEIGARALGRGWPVWSNAGFDFEGSALFSGFEEFFEIPEGCRHPENKGDHPSVVCEHGLMLKVGEGHPVVILWDELPVYVNARKWQEFPDGMMYRLTQVRKDGIRFYYSTIDMKFVDVNVRKLTFWEWQCRAITSRVLVRAKFGHPELRRKDEKPRQRELVIVKDRIAGLYDTHRKVKVFEDKKRSAGARVAPSVNTAQVTIPQAVPVIGKSEPRHGQVPGLLDPRDSTTETRWQTG